MTRPLAVSTDGRATWHRPGRPVCRRALTAAGRGASNAALERAIRTPESNPNDPATIGREAFTRHVPDAQETTP